MTSKLGTIAIAAFWLAALDTIFLYGVAQRHRATVRATVNDNLADLAGLHLNGGRSQAGVECRRVSMVILGLTSDMSLGSTGTGINIGWKGAGLWWEASGILRFCVHRNCLVNLGLRLNKRVTEVRVLGAVRG